MAPTGTCIVHFKAEVIIICCMGVCIVLHLLPEVGGGGRCSEVSDLVCKAGLEEKVGMALVVLHSPECWH